MTQVSVSAYDASYLPILRAYADKLDLQSTIDECINGEMEISPGLVVKAMVLDAGTGRTPLFRLNDYFRDKDREVLLGEDIPPEKLRDHTLGRVLDRLYDFGTRKILTRIAAAGLKLARIEQSGVHFDTTSIRTWGDFDPEKDDPVLMTYGHSKDRRPDLKQFVISLLTVKGGLPVMFSAEDGKASDQKLNGDVIAMISDYFSEHGLPELKVYVADSAMVNQENLRLLGDIPFVSLLPGRYSARAELAAKAVAADEWTDLGTLARASGGSKRAAKYQAWETAVELHGETYRACVYHSSAGNSRGLKSLDRQIQREKQALEAEARQLAKREFFCEADALAEAAKLRNGAHHTVAARVEEKPIYGRGRPASSGKRVPKAIRHVLRVTVEENAEAVSNARKVAGCFVLISRRLDPAEVGSAQLLRIYKEQSDVEKNFEFLKDPMILDSLFLKTPRRIEALALVLVITLFIWRLAQYIMRQRLAQHGRFVPGWKNKPTQAPTTFMMTTKFRQVIVLTINGERKFAAPLRADQLAFLWALDLEETIYLQTVT